MRESYRVAVVGATGAVGNTMLQLLEERSFPGRFPQTSGIAPLCW